MDSSKVIRALMRVFRPFIGRGINAGIDLAARKGKPASEMTPEERQQAQKGKQLTKRARQMAKMGRRMGRF
ncbi:MAG: hypothetical protein OEM24_02805 [Paracoccaceae bacterium]|nr:hypothetical protein [Paracoccaceae bacterium]